MVVVAGQVDVDQAGNAAAPAPWSIVLLAPVPAFWNTPVAVVPPVYTP